jgi:hypothetical protein
MEEASRLSGKKFHSTSLGLVCESSGPKMPETRKRHSVQCSLLVKGVSQ